ncbi:hypothetical protein BCR39DRAFT_554087 [Naematelia encephala]|uniref:Uncharacterized protein n=1 Tax=Naematelia encephala TaxID=71784 RepID=A0A1Y2AF73_9TREE|nr:hypothetical protein BCR39DRAFT_554087 [Naematelia encephala]
MTHPIRRSSRQGVLTSDHNDDHESLSTISTGITSYILGDLRREANARMDERERRNALKDFDSTPTSEWDWGPDLPRGQERVEGTEIRNFRSHYRAYQQARILEDEPDMAVPQRDRIHWFDSDSSTDFSDTVRGGNTGVLVDEQSSSPELSESETVRENYCVAFPTPALGGAGSLPIFSSSSNDNDHDPFHILPGFHAITSFSPYTNSANMITRPHEIDCDLPSSPLEGRFGTKSTSAMLTCRNDARHTEIDEDLDYQQQIRLKTSPSPSPLVSLGQDSRPYGDGNEEETGDGGNSITTPDFSRQVLRDIRRIPLSSGRRVRVRNGILKLLAR